MPPLLTKLKAVPAAEFVAAQVAKCRADPGFARECCTRGTLAFLLDSARVSSDDDSVLIPIGDLLREIVSVIAIAFDEGLECNNKKELLAALAGQAAFACASVLSEIREASAASSRFAAALRTIVRAETPAMAVAMGIGRAIQDRRNYHSRTFYRAILDAYRGAPRVAVVQLGDVFAEIPTAGFNATEALRSASSAVIPLFGLVEGQLETRPGSAVGHLLDADAIEVSMCGEDRASLLDFAQFARAFAAPGAKHHAKAGHEVLAGIAIKLDRVLSHAFGLGRDDSPADAFSEWFECNETYHVPMDTVCAAVEALANISSVDPRAASYGWKISRMAGFLNSSNGQLREAAWRFAREITAEQAERGAILVALDALRVHRSKSLRRVFDKPHREPEIDCAISVLLLAADAAVTDFDRRMMPLNDDSVRSLIASGLALYAPALADRIERKRLLLGVIREYDELRAKEANDVDGDN